MKTLILIGLQVDMLPGGGAEVPDSEGLAATISPLLLKYDFVVAANFWLPVEHQVFAANHPWRKPGQPMEVGGSPGLLKNFYCIQGSFGAEMMPGIPLEKIDFTAQMGTQPDHLPHSAFFDDGKRDSTGLLEFLREKKVVEIHLAGMPLEAEVKQTALDALELGFAVKLLKNACRGLDDVAVGKALEEMESAGAVVNP